MSQVKLFAQCSILIQKVHIKATIQASQKENVGQLASDFYVSQYRASSSSSRMLGKYLDLVEGGAKGLASNVDENILSIAVL